MAVGEQDARRDAEMREKAIAAIEDRTDSLPIHDWCKRDLARLYRVVLAGKVKDPAVWAWIDGIDEG